MSLLKEIFELFAVVVIETAHRFGVIYIPQRDAAPWPFECEKQPEKVAVKQVARPDNVRTRTVGGDIFAPGRVIQHLEEFYDMEGGAAWDLRRYDGKEGMPDFSDWHGTDDAIVAADGYTERTVKNYIVVRPLVVQGMSNREIAVQTGLGLRTVEKVAGSVRAAFRMRIEQAVNPSPTNERGDEVGEAPQMTANITKPA